ncbi:DUF1127 domain-containing protein [Shimia sp. R9_3]|uniref:DUF1127 domain-containing protein n=1 Tax=Shimia sp. R9_3 TaxID=2821113 RepID=UPI001ADA857C|nr:DUF1127 domain-containing protein [Shimia sp. R9_3]MBO9401875.1 DUF1127 domain-containing protein [Shimia sp. R9_3]
MTMTTAHLESLTSHAANAQLPVAARLALSFAALVTAWDQRARTRRALSKLDAAQLKDIGVSLADARAEVEKKMWQI